MHSYIPFRKPISRKRMVSALAQGIQFPNHEVGVEPIIQKQRESTVHIK